MFMVHDLNVFQIVFNHKQVWERKKNKPLSLLNKHNQSFIFATLQITKWVFSPLHFQCPSWRHRALKNEMAHIFRQATKTVILWYFEMQFLWFFSVGKQIIIKCTCSVSYYSKILPFSFKFLHTNVTRPCKVSFVFQLSSTKTVCGRNTSHSWGKCYFL